MAIKDRIKAILGNIWWKRLSNKYTLATGFFIIWMALEDGIEFYQKELEDISRQLDELASDPEKLEKFAREQYWMHRPGEHLILVQPVAKP